MDFMQPLTNVTQDLLLGGRLRLLQPADGYRAAIDPVLLAAAVPALAGQQVLDVGCGVGTAGLCLALREPECRVTGLELQTELADLAARNLLLNGLAERVEVACGDLRTPPFPPGSFDHVMTNPPYHQGGTLSPHAGKALANSEGELPLADWLKACCKLLKPKGSLVVIQRADRLEEMLGAMQGRLGGVTVYPLWPKAGREAKRVLLWGTKGSKAPLTLAAGLMLHEEDGSYTERADALLRQAAGL